MWSALSDYPPAHEGRRAPGESTFPAALVDRVLHRARPRQAAVGGLAAPASLQMMFYTGKQFPAEYYGNVFAAEHGSWNRTKRTGHKIIRGFVKDGVPSGPYEDFAIGFVIDNDRVWGRPVGITQGKDGSLLFSDDGNGAIWRVSYVGNHSH
jgi:glucose/arabinose dehydrogenase